MVHVSEKKKNVRRERALVSELPLYFEENTNTKNTTLGRSYRCILKKNKHKIYNTRCPVKRTNSFVLV